MKLTRAFVAVAVLAGGIAVAAAPAQAATSMSISWQLPANGSYAIGIDHVNTAGVSPGGYEQFYEYPTSLYNNNPILPNPLGIYSGTTLSEARMEIYSRKPGSNYDALAGDGAIVLRLPSSKNVGMLKFPVLGQVSVGKFSGSVLSRSAMTTGRVRIEIFQTTGQPLSTTGYPIDAFSATNSVGASYATGPLWNGQYLAFVTDTATGRQAIGFMYLSGDTRFDLDLDIACFGIDECQFAGTVPNSQGAFHSLTPARLVDTRKAQGMPGVLLPGDGRNNDPNPFHRADSRVGHEFLAAGVGGVPAAGVSAVLVNITVTGGTQPGSLRLIPKPPRAGVWLDQSSYPAANYQAPAIHWTAGETRASLQLVKVGVGGKIRVDSVSYGSVQFIVDVVGWVDQGQPNQSGDRVLSVPPVRLLDTRTGVGGPQTPFGAGETRNLTVVDVGGIPRAAKGVIGNFTSVQSHARTWSLVWPQGGSRPTASVLNSESTVTRPNLVISGVSASGQWSIYNDSAPTALIFDAVGYFTSASGAGGRITAVPSATLVNQAPLTGGRDAAVKVTGVGGVPASGVSAVWVLATARNAPAGSWLTLYPTNTTRPNASNLNWTAGQTVANLVLVPVGPDGNIYVYTNSNVSLSLDVQGWVN